MKQSTWRYEARTIAGDASSFLEPKEILAHGDLQTLDGRAVL